ncbi:MAG: hypothetical protein FWG71_08640 [Synergistaceae bacterium]|nr:hypothetical protein [Synergistaceae bacterium]
MSFDSKSARAAGQVGGKRSAAKRWGEKDPVTIRNKPILLRVTHDELDLMDAKAASEGISRTELVIRAVREYGGVKHLPPE